MKKPGIKTTRPSPTTAIHTDQLAAVRGGWGSIILDAVEAATTTEPTDSPHDQLSGIHRGRR